MAEPVNKLEPFEMKIRVWWSEEDQAYLAKSETEPFHLLGTHGETREEALREYSFVLHAVMEAGQVLGTQ